MLAEMTQNVFLYQPLFGKETNENQIFLTQPTPSLHPKINCTLQPDQQNPPLHNFSI